MSQFLLLNGLQPQCYVGAAPQIAAIADKMRQFFWLYFTPFYEKVSFKDTTMVTILFIPVLFQSKGHQYEVDFCSPCLLVV